MYSCRVEGKTVVREATEADVRGDWRRLVRPVKLGVTQMNGYPYTVVRFDTKSGRPEDAIRTPGGLWMLNAFESRMLTFQ